MTICSPLKLCVVVFFWIIPPQISCANKYRPVVLSWKKDNESHDSNLVVWSILVFSGKLGSHALKVVTVRALLSAFCLAVAPILWLLLAMVALV